MGKNKGAVLIMALLIVALVSTMAVSFASVFQLSFARAENRWHGTQARAYLLGTESIALDALADDLAASSTDHLEEVWAKVGEMGRLPLEDIQESWIEGFVEDAQARINLNDLTAPVNTGRGLSPPMRFNESQRRFIRLLRTFEDLVSSPDEAIAIMEALIDWVDGDDNVTGFGGAEEGYYSGLDTSYSPANQPFASVTELRLLRHMTEELYVAVLPYVVVLPSDNAGLNINTTSGKLLQTINDKNKLEPLSEYDANQLLSAREDKLASVGANETASGYEEVSEFTNEAFNLNVFATGAEIDDSGLAVNSEYFLLHAQVQLVRQRRRLTSLIYRQSVGGSGSNSATSVIVKSIGRSDLCMVISKFADPNGRFHCLSSV